MPQAKIRSIRDLNLKNKRVFMRLDLNAPLTEADADGQRQVSDDNRILESLPTIQYALEQGARLIIASHLGRPDGKVDPRYSLEPVARCLAEKLNRDITLAEDCVGEGVVLMSKALRSGDLMVLENLRFHVGEEKNSPHFVQQLAELTDIYVSDAFGSSHRKHGSTYGLPQMVGEKAMGFLMEKELKFLNRLWDKPASPFYMILGGSKVSDKIKMIEALLSRVDGICIGGAMAFAFAVARGEKLDPRAKKPSEADVVAADQILKDAAKKEVAILLPVDHVDTLDIGPETVKRFLDFLAPAQTLFWNGPLGMFEKSPYEQGTFDIARGLATIEALKVVGGGDTVAAIHQSGSHSHFAHLSTGGGAVLEYLEAGHLPGTDILAAIERPGIVLDASQITDEEEERADQDRFYPIEDEIYREEKSKVSSPLQKDKNVRVRRQPQ